MNENVIEIIEAIGKQWKFLITIFIIIIFIIKWKTIWSFLENFTQIRVKRGDKEIELHRKESEKDKSEDEINQEKDKPESESSEADEEKLEKSKEPDSPFYLYQNALSEKKFNDAESHFKVMLEEEKDLLKRNELQIRDFYWRYIYGDLNAFEELENYSSKIENDNEQKSYALYYLGLIYDESNNYKKASELISEAIELSNRDEQKSQCIGKLSTIHFDNEFKDKALNIILDNIDTINDRVPKSNLYRSIADYYKKTENKVLEAVAYQKALELSPNNTSLMFDSAYNYCEVEEELKDVGAFIYKKLLYVNPDNSGALNNLGVAYNNLDLELKSVNTYKSGFEKGSTLAASNIAYLLINNGFKDEALEYLNKAKDLEEDTHDNIFSATTHLNNKARKENETEEKILKKAQKKYKFLAFYGDAAFTNNVLSIKSSDDWIVEDKECVLNITEGLINLKWANGDEKHEISGKLAKNSISTSYEKPKKNIYSFSDENKYTYSNHKGFGYIKSLDELNFLFEIEKKIVEFKFKKK